MNSRIYKINEEKECQSLGKGEKAFTQMSQFGLGLKSIIISYVGRKERNIFQVEIISCVSMQFDGNMEMRVIWKLIVKMLYML